MWRGAAVGRGATSREGGVGMAQLFDAVAAAFRLWDKEDNKTNGSDMGD